MVLKEVSDVIGSYSGYSRTVLEYSQVMKRLVEAAKQPGFSVDSWAPLHELVAIDAAKETNAAIRIFWKLLDDPRTDYVDRNLEPIQSVLQSLEADGLIGAGRAQEIIHGEVTK